MSENQAKRYDDWQNHCDELIEKLAKEEIIKKVDLLPDYEYYTCKPNLEIELKYDHGIINYKNCKTILFFKDKGAISIGMNKSKVKGSQISQIHYLNTIKDIR